MPYRPKSETIVALPTHSIHPTTKLFEQTHENKRKRFDLSFSNGVGGECVSDTQQQFRHHRTTCTVTKKNRVLLNELRKFKILFFFWKYAVAEPTSSSSKHNNARTCDDACVSSLAINASVAFDKTHTHTRTH